MANSVIAHNTIGSDPGSKWDDPNWGTGAIISWSFMQPGVGLWPGKPAGWTGTNTLGSENPVLDIRTLIDAEFGEGAFDVAVQRAFDTWTHAANVQFNQVTEDPVNFENAGNMGEETMPDIRIGAYDFGNTFSGGSGYGPPGDDINFPDPLAGDIALNNANKFTIANGGEGDELPLGPMGEFLNDIEHLILHEVGHTLGLAHSDDINAVMCGFVFGTEFNGSECVNLTEINRELSPDDIAGITSIYGQAIKPPVSVVVPVMPVIGLLMLSLLLGFTGVRLIVKQ